MAEGIARFEPSAPPAEIAAAVQADGAAIVDIGRLVTIPFPIEEIKTPYGGVFMVDSAITVGAALLIFDSLFLSGKEKAAPGEAPPE